MKKYVIVADATCDLSEAFQKEYDIKVIPGHIKTPDKGEISILPGWNGYDRDKFYADLKKNPDAYTTSPANVEEFRREFEKYALQGYDIISLTISGGISGAHGFATKASQLCKQNYPDVRIACIDSRRFGPGFGLLTVCAAQLKQQGKSFDEVVDYIEKNKNKFHQAGWLDDLSFVAKKGRITHPKAFFGTLAGIKPIGEFDYNGLTTVIGKVKGAKKAYSVLLSYIEETIENPSEQIIFIAHTSRYKQALEYKEMIENRFHPKAIYINDVHPLCGINIGPGLMAAYYIGKPISAELSQEREIITKYIESGE